MSERVAATVCLPAARLDFWAERRWDDGVQVSDLRPFARIRVKTRNSVYDLVVGVNGDALVRGGRFFPEYTRVVVLGSSLGGAFLKVGGIYRGFSMELLHDGARLVTSRVDAVHGVPDSLRVH